MNQDLIRARQLLQAGGYTCVFCHGDTVITDTRRGIRPLLELYRNKTDLHAFSAADKVVGKAAAFLYRLMGVKSLYAGVVSTPALAALEGVSVEYGTETPAVVNHSQTGLCPMEAAVWELNDAQDALAAIERTLAQMK